MRGAQTPPDQPEIATSPDLQEAGDSGVEAAAFLNVPVSVYVANCLAQLLFVWGFILSLMKKSSTYCGSLWYVCADIGITVYLCNNPLGAERNPDTTW